MTTNKHTVWILLVLVSCILIWCLFSNKSEHKKVDIELDCSTASLGANKNLANAGTTIRLTGGTCKLKNPVVIRGNGITIDGQGINIDGENRNITLFDVKSGSHGVTFKNFTASNAKLAFMFNSGTFSTIENVTTRNMKEGGVFIQGYPDPGELNPELIKSGSNLALTSAISAGGCPQSANTLCTSFLSVCNGNFNSGGFGLRAQGAYIDIGCGTNNFNSNTKYGILANATSTVLIRNTIVNANNNGLGSRGLFGFGIGLSNSSNWDAYSSEINANNNTNHGVRVVSQSDFRLIKTITPASPTSHLNSNGNNAGGGDVMIGNAQSDTAQIRCDIPSSVNTGTIVGVKPGNIINCN